MTLKRLLLILVSLIIGTEGFITLGYANLELPKAPQKIFSEILQPFRRNPFMLPGQVADYGSHFLAESRKVNLALGQNILADVQNIKDYSSHFGTQATLALSATTKNIASDTYRAEKVVNNIYNISGQLASDLWKDLRAPYVAALDVISPSLRQQANQFAWATQNAGQGWNGLAQFVGKSITGVYKINRLAFSEQIESTKQYALSLLPRKNSGGQIQLAQNTTPMNIPERVWHVSPRGEEPQVLGEQINATFYKRTSSQKQSTQTSSLTKSQVEQLMNDRLDEYTKFLSGLLRSSPPAKGEYLAQRGEGVGAGTGIFQNSTGGSTAVIGGTPIVTYVPPVQSTGFGGASLAGFTQLSAQGFSTETAVINNTLNVSGGTTLSTLTVNNTATFATSTIANLTVTGSTTLSSLSAGTIILTSTSTLATTTITNLTLTQPLALNYGGLGFDASGIAKGGIFAGTGNGTVGIQTVGADGLCLLASSTSVSGLAWTNCAVAANAITSLGGLTNPVQLLATGTATGIGLNITSSGSTHTFTPTVSSGYVIPLSASTTEWSSFYNTPSGRITAANNLLWTGNTLGVAAGYNIPLTASTTNWNGFYDVPSTRITAGTNMSWSGNTLNGASDGYIRGLLSSSATGLTYTPGTGVFSLTSGYNIPLTASTTNWNNFYNTPSGQITAGTGLSWSSNTLNSVWTASGNNIYNNNSGNVGIGTTGPQTVLDIKGLNNDNLGQLRLQSIARYAGLSFWTDTSQTNNRNWQIQNNYNSYGNLDFMRSTTNTGNPTIPVMSLDMNGNVGIGTTSPASKLHIYENSSNVSAGTGLTVEQAGTGDAEIQYLLTGTRRWVTGIDNSDSKFKISPSVDLANAVFTIDTSGNVGIGTTSPSGKLEIYGQSSYNNGLVIAGSGVLGSSVSLKNTDTGGKTFDIISTGSSNSPGAGTLGIYEEGGDYRLVIKSGNVGIGTTSPQGKLNVYSGASGATVSTAADDFVVEGSGNTGMSILAPNAAQSILYFGTASQPVGAQVNWDYSNSLMRIGTNKTGGQIAFENGALSEVMRIVGGNVGIGTTGPLAMLHLLQTGQTSGITSATNLPGVVLSGTVPRVYFEDTGEASGKKVMGITYDSQNLMMQSFTDTANGYDQQYILVANRNGNIGIGTTGPQSKLHIANASVPNAYYGSTPSMVLESTDSVLQLLSTDGGSYASSLILSSAPSSGNNKHWLLDHRGVNQNDNFVIGYGTTASGGSAISPQYDYLAITTTGNVGIGTTSPTAGLHIGSAASGKNVRIANGWLCVDDNDTCTGATTAGNIYMVGAAITSGADVAENYPTVDSSLEPGDVVSANPGFPVHVSKATHSAGSGQAPAVLGIVSTKPGVLLNGYKAQDFGNASTVPVGLAGRVPVKVTNENGNIKIGDYLTISKTLPGYAMKATEPGQVFGRALENFNSATPSSSGKILVFIQFTYYQPTVAEMLQNGQNSGNLELEAWLQSLTNINQTNASAFGDIVVTGSVAIQKDLTVKGVIYAAELKVDFITSQKVNSKEVNSEKINTSQLCVDDVCVTREQFLKMVQQANGASSNPSSPASSEQTVIDPAPEVAGTSTSPSEPAIVSPPITENPTPEPVISEPTNTPPPTPVTDPASTAPEAEPTP